MKQRIYGIVIGSLITILFFSITAWAATNTASINIVYRAIKLYVDGVQIVPKDVNGNIVEPFLYNGTTYLPVRAVGEAFGKQVDWDGNTSTVYVGRKPLIESEASEGTLTKTYTYNADGSLACWVQTEYDANGTITKYIVYFGDGISQHSEYDANGNVVTFTVYNADGLVDVWHQREYDDKGNLIKDQSYNADGSKLYLYIMEYDANGNCTKETVYRADGTSAVAFSEYDAKGNLTVQTAYEYDATGNLIEKLERNFGETP